MLFSIIPCRRWPLTYVSLFITLLVLMSAPAYAEWVKVATGDNGNVTTYADPDTIRRKGDLVKMWSLVDSKTIRTVAGTSHLSYKMEEEYDCAKERSRTLTLDEFSGNMGNGNLVWQSPNEQKWAPLASDSLGISLWKFACGKK
jgi:hypothetical protein